MFTQEQAARQMQRFQIDLAPTTGHGVLIAPTGPESVFSPTVGHAASACRVRVPSFLMCSKERGFHITAISHPGRRNDDDIRRPRHELTMGPLDELSDSRHLINEAVGQTDGQ